MHARTRACTNTHKTLISIVRLSGCFCLCVCLCGPAEDSASCLHDLLMGVLSSFPTFFCVCQLFGPGVKTWRVDQLCSRTLRCAIKHLKQLSERSVAHYLGTQDFAKDLPMRLDSVVSFVFLFPFSLLLLLLNHQRRHADQFPQSVYRRTNVSLL